MNPNFYRSASPQPTISASPREHAVRQLYPPYGAPQEMLRIHPMAAGSPYGFMHPHAATAGHFYPSPVGFHLPQGVELTQRPSGNPVEPPRPTSPSRRRQAMLGDYVERERYIRTISPTENRPPAAPQQMQRQSHPRPPSPRAQMQQHPGNHLGGVYPGLSGGGNRNDYRDSHERYVVPKKAKLTDNHQRDMSVQEAYNRGGPSGMVKLEMRNNQDYMLRPIPLEAISPPATEECTEVDRMCQQVEADIRGLGMDMKICEKNVDQWEAELKTAEARKVRFW